MFKHFKVSIVSRSRVQSYGLQILEGLKLPRFEMLMGLKVQRETVRGAESKVKSPRSTTFQFALVHDSSPNMPRDTPFQHVRSTAQCADVL